MSARPARILIAEDDPVIGRVLSRNLEREGFDVVLAPNGTAALAAVEQGGVSFLLADYQMPDMTGEALCRTLRSNPAYSSLPIAMCTAKAHEVDTAALVAELQLTTIFYKPFSLREIVAAIRETLATSVTC